MLTCVPRLKQRDDHDEPNRNSNRSMKRIGSQIKVMAVKASGEYRICNPYSERKEAEIESSATDKFRWTNRRTGSKNPSSDRMWGKEMEARLKGISMGSGRIDGVAAGTLSGSASSRRLEPVVLVDEIEPIEWVAQIEPGVLITFISLPRGGNNLKQIRFSREMFNKWQAQRWWQENFDKVMELYNVQRLSRQAFPLPTPPNSEDELAPDLRRSKIEITESVGDGPLTPTLTTERQPHILQPDHQGSNLMESNRGSSGLTVTPKLSSISGTKTETSSMETDQSGEISISNVSDIDNEWVEEDEPGVYLTIRVVPGGLRELRRVRFSREKFGEVHARIWWEDNRARIHKQYL